MAFSASNLTCLVGMAPGRNVYRYDTTDALTTVEVSGYMNNSDDDLNIAKGDIFWVCVWDTVDTGFPTDIGLLVCNDVASGAVSLTTDQLAGTFTSTA